jgi:hypothetical protein
VRGGRRVLRAAGSRSVGRRDRTRSSLAQLPSRHVCGRSLSRSRRLDGGRRRVGLKEVSPRASRQLAGPHHPHGPARRGSRRSRGRGWCVKRGQPAKVCCTQHTQHAQHPNQCPPHSDALFLGFQEQKKKKKKKQKKQKNFFLRRLFDERCCLLVPM